MTGGEPVAVVGMAGLFPAAPDVTTFWRNVVGGHDAITEVPAERWDPEYYDPAAAGAERFYCRRGGFVDDIATFDPARFGIMPVAVDHADPDQFVALAVAAAAIEDAGGHDALCPDPRRVAVVLGRGGYYNAGVVRLDQRVRVAEQVCVTLREVVPGLTAEQVALVREAFRQKLGPEHPEAMIGLVPSLTASRIANRLDLQGPAYTVDAACASSLVAVDQAVHELRSGRCDVVLAGGSHHCHDVTFWSVFTQLGALSRTGVMRPFDRRADGLLIGEGTGVLVLQRLADAVRDGRRVYAVIRGTGVASDGRDTSLMRPKMAGQLLALERAWQDAGLDPATVGLLEAHGTATPAGDRTELETIAAFFGHAPDGGTEPGRGDRPGVGSVKSMIGHTMPAAGAAGMIKAVLALHHGVLPPTLHCEEPSRALAATRFRVVAEAEPWEDTGVPRRAGVNAFGFGGTNAHVVLEEAPGRSAGGAGGGRPARPVAASAPAARGSGAPAGQTVPAGDRVLLLAGEDPADIAAQLGTAEDDAALLARDDLADPPDGPVRLALVAPNPKRLALARRVVGLGRPWRGRNDLWFSPDGLLAPGRGRVVFLFPGVEPEFAPRVASVAELLGEPAPEIGAVGMIGFQAQAIVTVGRLLDRALRACGVVPDEVGGHSVGEMTAGLAAGLAPEAEYDAVIAGIDVARMEFPDTLFAALSCGVAQAEAAIAGEPEVVVSHDNCPHQSIICGEEAAVRRVLERLRAQRVMSMELPFRSGFHSPMLEPYLGPIDEMLSRLPVLERSVPMWSATLCAPYPPDEAGVRDVAIRHLVEPVRFCGMIEAMWADGVRGFVQVGTGSLTGFVEDTLHGRDILCVDAASAKRDGVDQLRRVAAALWAEGRAGVRPQALVAGAPTPAAAAVEADAGAPVDLAPSGTADGAPAGGRPGPADHARPLRLGAPLIRLGGSLQLAVAPPDTGNRPAAATVAASGTSGPPAVTGPVSLPGDGRGARLGSAPSGGPVPSTPAPAAGALGTPGAATVPTVPPAPATTAGSPDGTAGSGLLADLQSLLDEVAAAGAAVVRAHQDGTGLARPASPRPPSHRPAPHRPAGRPVPAAPGPGRSGGRPMPTGPVGPGEGVRAGAPAAAPPGAPVATPGVPVGTPPASPPPASGPPASGTGTPASGTRPGVAPVVYAGPPPRRPGDDPVRREWVLTVSLETMPWIDDHAFFHMPPGWPEAGDRFPVVPMTGIMQIMADEAVAAVPGTVATGIRTMRAMRWTAAVPPRDVTVRSTRTAEDEVRVVLDGYAKGAVAVAASYPPPPRVEERPLTRPRPSPYNAAELYSERWMFHGPRYHSVVQVGPIGDDGLEGRIRCGEAPGSLLDAAAQLIGFWVHMTQTYNQMALPSVVADVRFFGPHPPVGAELRCLLRVTDLQEDRVVADVDIADDDGVVWCRITGWEERRFVTDSATFEAFKWPERRMISTRQPGGWFLIREGWNDAATRELLVRNFADATERAEYERLNPRQQRYWTLGRVVAKDALRHWLLENGADSVFPIELRLRHDERGAPLVESDIPEVAGLNVSVAHTDWVGVAIVGHDRRVGIDIEPVADRSDRFTELIAGPAERQVVADAERAGHPPDELRTRCWCAKEAVAKARGTGLEGNPRGFEIDAIEGDRLRVAGQWVETTVVTVGEGAYVVAWTAG